MMEQRGGSSLIGKIVILLVNAVILIAAFFRARMGIGHEPAPVVNEPGVPYWIRRGAFIGFGVVFAILVAVFAMYWPLPAPSQPIPFSHRVHNTKNLNCFFCHPSATYSSNAGMPPVEKCLLCHNVIAAKFQPIAKIHSYFRKNESIPWVRVNRVPGFVRFSHQIHLARRFDCSECHGNVKEMDRIRQVHKFDMNFCVTCHWRNNGPDSCFACHY